jgi:transketolase
MTTFGASGKIDDLYKHFNITVDHAVSKAQSLIQYFEKLGYVPEVNVQL